MRKVITIIIANDHRIFREGLNALLKDQEQVQVLALASDGEELVTLTEKLKPDIVLTDIRMPKMDGVLATKHIKNHWSEVGVIALSSFESEFYIHQMLEAGAKGYLLKNASKEEIVEAVQKVANRRSFYCTTISEKIIEMFEQGGRTYSFERKKNVGFSARELDIINLICQEHCSKEIAVLLNTNARSIESSRKRIQEKINCKNMAGIVVHAIRKGIFHLD